MIRRPSPKNERVAILRIILFSLLMLQGIGGHATWLAYFVALNWYLNLLTADSPLSRI